MQFFTILISAFFRQTEIVPQFLPYFPQKLFFREGEVQYKTYVVPSRSKHFILHTRITVYYVNKIQEKIKDLRSMVSAV
jgi:hypothetical protein